jgi:signal peptidase
MKERASNRSSKNLLKSWVFGLLAYLPLLAAALLLHFSSDSNQTRIIFGYSAFAIASGSMTPDLPENSLAIVKVSDPAFIKVGDDIFFIRTDRNIVTHRVIGIEENYMQSGMRGFKTKGTANQEPDREIAYADNVIGKVIFHSPVVGSVLTYLKSHVWFVSFMFFAAVSLAALLTFIFKEQNASKIAKEAEPEIAPTSKT